MYSDLISSTMGAPMLFEADTDGAGGSSTVMTGGDPGAGDGDTVITGGDGGDGDNGDKGGATEFTDWRGQLSADLKGNEFIKGFEGNISDFAGKLIELQGSTKGMVALPSEDATPEARAEAYKGIMKHFGHPETVEGYEFTKPESMPEGMPYDEARVQDFAKMAHELGVPKDVAQAIVQWSDKKAIADHTSSLESIGKANTERLNAMKQEHGNDFKAVAEGAHRAAEAFGGDELMTFLDETGLGDHPVLIKAFAAISKSISEDSARLTLQGGGAGKVDKNVDAHGKGTLDFSKSMGSGQEG